MVNFSAPSLPIPQGAAITLSHNSLYRIKCSQERANHPFQIPVNVPEAMGAGGGRGEGSLATRFDQLYDIYLETSFPLINARIYLEYVTY